MIFPRQSSIIGVVKNENNTNFKVDMRTAGAYVLTMPQWSSMLNQSVILCVWVKNPESPAPFQYLFEMIESHQQDCLPHWIIFCKKTDNLPNNVLKWREPSTMWKSWPLIAFVSDTDLLDDNATTRSAEVGFRNFPPMWPILPNVLQASKDNISFGMSLTHVDPHYYEIEAILAQCPIVCFSVARYGSDRIAHLVAKWRPAQQELLPSDLQLSDSYDTPGDYSDQLAQHGAPTLLAHECIIPVICNMSNNQKLQMHVRLHQVQRQLD